MWRDDIEIRNKLESAADTYFPSTGAASKNLGVL